MTPAARDGALRDVVPAHRRELSRARCTARRAPAAPASPSTTKAAFHRVIPRFMCQGGRLHAGNRHRAASRSTPRRVDLRGQVRRRELRQEAHRPWDSLHGQRWARYQRVPVLHLHREDLVARREACRFRAGRGRDGGR
ncbi:uncharacterized protein A4U43_C04F8220 [Asparagus officinalis]|uniref:Uncharacterized protein n=1 Tax=Asparagus officinalis TaxID=4686 RepID=A0A5P1EZ80_ASPOF|nr:uncharacterized protein A4U43_C04F8220 [Asparagus officinalis]